MFNTRYLDVLHYTDLYCSNEKTNTKLWYWKVKQITFRGAYPMCRL